MAPCRDDGSPSVSARQRSGRAAGTAQAFDLTAQRPCAFCVKTIIYAEDGTGQKIPEIFQLFESNDYFAYADTYVNTIFVDRRR